MKLFQKNVGEADRAVRIVLGLLLFGAILWGLVTDTIAWIVAIIGIAALATGIFGTCMLYTVLGINTHATKAKGKKKK
jgi:hypothetical protein